MHFTIMAEVDATDLFKDEGVNWKYCKKHATFTHQAGECEFILHIGSGDEGEPLHPDIVIEEMRAFGCTEDFIQAYDDARQAGAVRVLFYV